MVTHAEALRKRGRVCSIPALRRPDGVWCRGAKSKADHLAETSRSKYQMEPVVDNDYTDIDTSPYRSHIIEGL